MGQRVNQNRYNQLLFFQRNLAGVPYCTAGSYCVRMLDQIGVKGITPPPVAMAVM
ncbi:MAG: hypothetical protein F6J98_24940 [Moorea sp. SIO4G2]|uniref:hypothetical protein n=1 Tax=unclassified Moorena TaxID=2683338 RepID=UPI0013C96738|nr:MULTISPECIES: hypothetical protein [unclassified Moorena]NEO63507.1 hypothetical protein [Moorena sp. SIO4G2]NEO91490.1 hypothetical protein [Moorena sp. SIO3G5]NEP23760.1 hypothetical protein [Moorena sp. SIO3I6]NEQ61881.1 hypothetical protein [Moorena sp. SIO4A1]